jgi:hypothetical protein
MVVFTTKVYIAKDLRIFKEEKSYKSKYFILLQGYLFICV